MTGINKKYFKITKTYSIMKRKGVNKNEKNDCKIERLVFGDE